jgi:hypothetical protein
MTGQDWDILPISKCSPIYADFVREVHGPPRNNHVLTVLGIAIGYSGIVPRYSIADHYEEFRLIDGITPMDAFVLFEAAYERMGKIPKEPDMENLEKRVEAIIGKALDKFKEAMKKEESE